MAEPSPQAQKVLSAVTQQLYCLDPEDIPNEAARIAEIASIVLRETVNQVREEQYTYAPSALSNILEISNSIKNHADQKL